MQLLQRGRGSVLSPCLRCLLGAHCEFGAAAASAAAAAAQCSYPPPRLTASSKPVMLQTTSSERRYIPFLQSKDQWLVSQRVQRKKFFFLPLLLIYPDRSRCCRLSTLSCSLLPPPEERHREREREGKPSGGDGGAGCLWISPTAQDRHGCAHGWSSFTNHATAAAANTEIGECLTGEFLF